MKRFLKNWLEPRILGAITAVCSLLLFLELAEEVTEGDTGAIDKAILLAFRTVGDVDDPLGPPWLEEFGRDITGLGSAGVLTMLVIATTVFLLLAGRARTALFVAAACFGGMIASNLLKALFDRARPDLVAHDIYLYTTSFPSGHAMQSAVVYLTLGALLARLVHRRILKAYVLSLAVFLAFIIGVSRVYLGVHWPSDVLAGWAIGGAWALGCWSLAQVLGIAGEETS